VLVLEVEVPAAVAGDAQHVDVRLGGLAAAGGGDAALDLGGHRPEALAQHEVHHPLVGAVAVLQRHLFGQHLDALDGFGRQVADFGEARDPPAVDQRDGRALRTAAAAADLRGQRLQQFGHGAGAVGPDVAGVERDLRRDVADH
jgi:hypothetical protein